MKILLRTFTVTALLIASPLVRAALDPGIYQAIRIRSAYKEEEDRKLIYIGLGIAALLAGGGYVLWRGATHKKCSHCKETIKEEAVVCKHCGKDLSI